MDVVLGGKKIKLSTLKSIGKGGEADIYKLTEDQTIKIFKRPDHPDFSGMPLEKEGAKKRIEEHQTKLPAFPSNLSNRVIRPLELVYDVAGKVAGYKMAFVQNAELLMRYGEKSYRESGVPDETVRKIFLDLHSTIEDTHHKGVVLGDFNDLNIMVKGEEAYLIDADSFQFGKFLCRVFTSKFVDPLLCSKDELILSKPHNEQSDWYAYLIMLMQSFLFVGPYGGVYKPKDLKNMIAHDKRPLRRITVFDPEVKYPKPARPYGLLPDELLHHLHKVFEKDVREIFPRTILEKMVWTKCTNCGAEHARTKCPNCAQAAPASIKEVTVIRGKVTATRIFQTNGVILQTSLQDGNLLWLYHENNKYRREDKSVVIDGPLDVKVRYRLRKHDTYLARGNNLIGISQTGKTTSPMATDSLGILPVYDTNENNLFWIDQGRLQKMSDLGPETIGDVLSGQTLFWVGKTFGFGFYRAGGLKVSFVFDTKVKGINDSVRIPFLPGKIIDTSCVFTDKRAFFFVSTEYSGKIVNQCFVIKSDGTVEASAQADKDGDSWLGTIRGKCAIGSSILSATDDGVVKVDIIGGKMEQTKAFPDTEPFVDSSTYLYPAKEGIFACTSKEIVLLKIS